MTKLALDLISSLVVFLALGAWLILAWSTIEFVRKWDWNNEDSFTVIGLFILFSATWVGVFWL